MNQEIYDYFNEKEKEFGHTYNKELIATINTLFEPVKYGLTVDLKSAYSWNVLEKLEAHLKGFKDILSNAFVFEDEDGEQYLVLSIKCEDKQYAIRSLREQTTHFFKDAYDRMKEYYTPDFLSKILILKEGLVDPEHTVCIGIPTIMLYYNAIAKVEKLLKHIGIIEMSVAAKKELTAKMQEVYELFLED